MIFEPDDFSGDPYAAGLNQIGHICLGAAFALAFGVWVGAAVFVAWEWFQLKYRGARKHDYFQDCFFWGFGVCAAGHWWLPIASVLLGGSWMGIVWLARRKS